MDDLDAQIARVRLELQQVRADGAKELGCWIRQKEKIKKKLEKAEKEIKNVLTKDLNKGSLHIYAESIKLVRGRNDAVPSYIVVLEAQMCRALHHIGNTQCQFLITKRKCVDLFKWMKKSGMEMAEEQSVAEMNAMNEICLVEEETTYMRERYVKQLKEQSESIESLKKVEPVNDVNSDTPVSATSTPELVREHERSLLQAHHLIALLEDVARSQDLQSALQNKEDSDSDTEDEESEAEADSSHTVVLNMQNVLAF